MNSDYLKKPILSKKSQSKFYGDFVIATCQMQGWRKRMQDSKICIQLQEDIYLFGILDGHGGPEVAHYVADMLPKQLLNEPHYKLKNYSKALTSVFKRIDEMIASERGEQHLRLLNKSLGSLPLGKNEKIGTRAGCTANILLMTKNKFYLANIGDSRAVLSRSDTTIPLSYDHKPDFAKQKERINEAGGYVHLGRVNGTLALSRSFGDFEYKHYSKKAYNEQPVISVPDIIQVDRNKQDQFILMACDGVWEKYVQSNPKMVSLIKQLYQKSPNNRVQILQRLFDNIVAKDLKDGLGCDNMSAILIEFL